MNPGTQNLKEEPQMSSKNLRSLKKTQRAHENMGKELKEYKYLRDPHKTGL